NNLWSKPLLSPPLTMNLVLKASNLFSVKSRDSNKLRKPNLSGQITTHLLHGYTPTQTHTQAHTTRTWVFSPVQWTVGAIIFRMTVALRGTVFLCVFVCMCVCVCVCLNVLSLE